jgi:hypothetical protein
MADIDYSAFAGSKSKALSNVQPGFGGRSQWDVISEYALGPSDVSELPGMQMTALSDIGKSTEAVDRGMSQVEASLDRLSAANASMLKGEIPADVAASVRRAAGESSIAGGLFGGSARALSARDLGKTSFDVRQQGIANESAVNESRGALIAARENIRQFNYNRNAAIAELSVKARQQNLSAIDVERQRIATNIEANINILNQIAGMVSAQQSTAAQAAANKIDPANIIESFDNMIEQFITRLS